MDYTNISLGYCGLSNKDICFPNILPENLLGDVFNYSKIIKCFQILLVKLYVFYDSLKQQTLVGKQYFCVYLNKNAYKTRYHTEEKKQYLFYT